MEIKVIMETGVITHSFNNRDEFLGTLFRYLNYGKKVQVMVKL